MSDRLRTAFLALLAAMVFNLVAYSLAAAQPAVKVGVLANSGAARCLEQWSPTGQYLNEKILGHAFSLVCLEFGEVGQAVRQGRVDFLLANPSIATELASLGVSPIATIKKPGSHSVFAGVIFCRASRPDIASLADLRGKTFMAVDPQSFGGWRMAWRELKQAGLDPQKDFAQLRFGGYQESVPLAVLAGEVDAGTARSGVLERLAREGRIKISDLRILGPRISDQLPLLHSTRLYPEWALARLEHTSHELVEKVAVALLSMPDNDPASLAASHAGWTTPENYQPVRELLRELRLGPFQDLGQFTLQDVLQRYWPMLAVSALLFVFMALSTALALRLNRRIRLAHQATLAEMEARRQAEEERERLLEELRAALGNVKKLSGLLPICAGCKRIRDDHGNWQEVERYLEQKSEAQFSHGICPECAARLYPDLFKKK
ncbi:MAG: phosphate/phosphite/phosphonate ABC transporter substrate-binding protein [Desulfarculus sp.]|nr:phosphate/phosphite/phosphonate ABC transporter substrate-binding protein [Desulfarculus sp.]